ncbi:hypothetical protein GCM10022215_30440 [Nocardioides fonticola]|uniref:Uncharacterized protein n=1 Tax=Nocardioides fonticola TaxID=450363 RepID=A0ABP7XQ36_9ACTN
MRTSLVPAIRPLVALVASAALVGSLAAPARAAATTDTDATGDAVTSSGSTSPNNQTADITSIAVTHGTSAVKVVVTLRDVDADNWNLVTAIRTPKSNYEVLLAKLSGTKYAVLSRKGTAITCKAMDTRIEDTPNTLYVYVPRSCLGRPASVRVGAVMTAKQGNTAVSDDARLNGALTSSGKPKLGPSVKAG